MVSFVVIFYVEYELFLLIDFFIFEIELILTGFFQLQAKKSCPLNRSNIYLVIEFSKMYPTLLWNL